MKQLGSHILVADDEPQIRKLFERLLTQGGYSVTAVESGAAAMEVIQNQVVDLLVLDLSMPEVDGFELLKVLRSTRPELRILAVSGLMEGVLLKASEILGATASLSKTEAPQLLVKTVNSLLQ
jgi:CheY-like chemotaxis protein